MSIGVGVIGCGNISGIYFKNLREFEETEVVACADLDTERARKVAEEQDCEAQSVQELLANSQVQIVLNLTVPKAHYSVAMAALEAGKHVYNEKPLAVDRAHGKELVDLARLKGLQIGCAPDTFLGGAHQTCRALIDEGAIGEPIGANCFMLCHGHESWHPSPEFYYEEGGGPLMDMGPYYLTALVNMMGPIAQVTAMHRISFPQRTITSQPKHGKVVEVETPTHIVAALRFVSGAIGQITTSFDVWHSKLPPIEVYGSEGSMLVPDPNGFGGEVWLRTSKSSEWELVPSRFGHMENSRGIGVRDMARVLLGQESSARASGLLAYHVLDVMHAILEAGGDGQAVSSRCPKPDLLVD